MNKYAAGAFAGLLATVPMTLAMTRLFPYLPRRQRYPLPPHEITVHAAERTGLAEHLPPERRTAATLAAHFGFGALSGALYPVTAARLHTPTALNGAVFGVAVWGLGYLGWVSGLGLLRPATDHPKKRVGLMILAHLVWGPATAGLANVLASGGSRDSRWIKVRSH